MSGNYAILPAAIRFDKKLSQGAKLLYAELTSVCGYDGLCKIDQKFLTNILDCDGRTLYRYLNQLLNRGYIQKTDTSGILKMPMGWEMSALSSRDIVVDNKPTIPDDLKKFFESFFRRFEEGLATSLDKKELYYETMAERMHRFSQNEMMQALENRIAFVNSSEWHQANRANAVDITLLIRDDQSLHKWLNMKGPDKSVTLTPFNFS